METVELTRDCEVTVIPGGDRMTLSAGTPVDITHSLGGTYTVRAGGGLYRVNPSDADALGKTVEETVAESGGLVTAERVHEALKNVYDPEIPVNIYDEAMYVGRIQINMNDGKKRKFLYFQSDYKIKNVYSDFIPSEGDRDDDELEGFGG